MSTEYGKMLEAAFFSLFTQDEPPNEVLELPLCKFSLWINKWLKYSIYVFNSFMTGVPII